MEDDRIARAESIFASALELPTGERLDWVRARCDGDAALAGEVRSLFEAHERSGVLDTPPTSSPDVPDRIGPYVVLRELGRGGMGSVHLAERDDPDLRQLVALKVVRRGLAADDLVRRFLVERQILASLDHPNVARLLDGGLLDDGRPYYAMELVDGEPIDRHCDALQLSVPDRLRLFADVARAVHHAHRSLIVHRDLKPTNILVTKDGVPKLLDFGIAKLLDPATVPMGVTLTRTGMRPLTPEYASPEQVRGDTVTTAADVYALGLLLYELLSGRRAQRVLGGTFADVERAVVTTEPPRPSQAAMRVEELRVAGGLVRSTAADVARARGVTPERLRRQLRGDLDRIVMHALRKEPERRYQSAAELADEVERHLAGMPVRAQGDAAPYRLRKFVTRHRWATAAGLVLVSLLGVYSTTVTLQAGMIRESMEQARLEAAKSEQVTAFVTQLLEADGAQHAREGADSSRMHELLRLAVARADALSGQPAVQAEVLGVMGSVYQSIGDFASARPLLERALATRRRLHGPDHLETGRSERRLGVVLRLAGDTAAAETHLRRAFAIHYAGLATGGVAAHAVVALDVGADLHELARLLADRGAYVEADSLAREALSFRRALLGPRHLDVARTLGVLGDVLVGRANLRDAARTHREALDITRAAAGDASVETMDAMHALATTLARMGDPLAEPLHRETLSLRRRVLGPTHPRAAGSLRALGTLALDAGRVAEAESLLVEAVAIHRAAGDRRSFEARATVDGLARVYERTARRVKADSLRGGRW